MSLGHAFNLGSQLVVAAGALWLMAAGLVALAAPAVARRFIGRMGSTPRTHLVEHLLRGSSGVALVVAADKSRYPMLFLWVGIFVVVSSLLILIAPRKWHARFSRGAAQKLGDGTLRMFGPVSLAAGAALLWAIRA